MMASDTLRITLVCALLLVLLVALTAPAQPQQEAVVTQNFPSPDTGSVQTQELLAASPDSAQTGVTTKIGKFWELYNYGGGIAYLITGVLMIGVFIIVFKFIELFFDNRHCKPLLELRMRGILDTSLDTIEAAVDKSKDCYLKQAYSRLIRFFRGGYSAANSQYELTNFKHQKYEQFDVYLGWLHFLSDSAGALGLLGTVWGVFQTFFGGNFDNEKILNGMGMALITTLFGLVVSLIINLLSTKLTSSFNKRMELVVDKADKLRLFLMDWEREKRPPVGIRTAAPLPLPVDPKASNGGVPLEQLFDRLGETITRSLEHILQGAPAIAPPGQVIVDNKVDYQLEVIKEPPQRIAAGEQVSKALRIRLIDAGGLPVTKEKIIFETDGELYLENKKNKRIEKQTDRSGQVAVSLIGGEHAGSAEVRYYMERHERLAGTVTVQVVSGKPEYIEILKGNYQTGKTGSPLRESLQIVVRDQFRNPVPGAEVLFKLLEGEGVFNGGRPEYLAHTDEEGSTAADFEFGSQLGPHRVQAAVRGSKCRRVEFELFATAHNS